MRPTVPLVAVAFVLVAACGGLGREDVQLLGPDAPADAGAVGSDAEADGAGDASLHVCPRPYPDGGQSCSELGDKCTVASECCSLRCESGVCLEPGMCAGPGVPCTTRSSCCSGRC